MQTSIEIVYAPNGIFKKQAARVLDVDDKVRFIVDQMFNIMYQHGAVGLGANMVGILQRIAVIDLQENNTRQPYVLINPLITYASSEVQVFEEGSLSYPGIRAEITRPKHIEVEYLDYNGQKESLKASGWMATVIQHELDYLDGKVFLDYLSPLKRNILLKKMQKSK
ncbi:MAG: peptide deformylase [Rickettsiaceae bacterium]|nr:peptide deformylase [Rickettsiaceae bacterium]MDP5020780.1 peptide deformylase [Rickettsiaceae bacterium]MDP5083312.1 peptide deformylase [Rickettsiaceae bacterium]